MRITPLDVRKQEFRRVVRGVDADEVHAFLATVADEYEAVLTDNKHLREKVMELDEKVGEYRTMERTLRDTLLTAERVMTEARQNARKEAELILRDAQLRASQATNNIEQRVDALRAQLRELRGQRDAFLARMQSLAEAQVGLVGSYRKDFSNDDDRIERLMRDPQSTGEASAAPREEQRQAPVNRSSPPAAALGAPAFLQPKSDEMPAADATRPVLPHAQPQDDTWRGYQLKTSSSSHNGPHSGPHSAPHVPSSYSEAVEPAYAEPQEAAAPARFEAVHEPTPWYEEQPSDSQAEDEVHGAVEHVLSIHESTRAQDLPVAEDLFETGPEHAFQTAPSGQGTPPVPTYPGPEPIDPVQMQAEAADVWSGEGQEAAAPTASQAADGSTKSAEETSRWSLSRFTRGLSGL